MTDVPPTPPDDLEKVKRKVGMLRETNSNIVAEIESLGGEVEITVARVEHMFEFLVQLGIITELQRWQEQYTWERDLKSQLVPVVQRLRTAPRPSRIN